MRQSNFKIAITGGIGSGKSAVSGIIAEQGLPVFSCDLVYGELLKDKSFLEKLTNEFGNILLADGTLDRNALSEKVFNDTNALKKLNALTHPAIISEVMKRAQGHRLSFCEVPLLFENGFEKLFDGVIVVLRDKERRISSVMARDGISRKNVILRVNSQFNYENKDFAEYYVIRNDGNLDDLRQKTLQILSKINNSL